MRRKDIQLELRGKVALVRLTRPAKRNALNDALLLALRDIFEKLPAEVGAAIIAGEGVPFARAST